MTDAITSFAELKKFRAHVRANLKALLLAKLLPGVRPEAWTPRQVFHHVLLAESGSMGLLERLVAKAKELSERDAKEPWPIGQELLDFPLDTAFSIAAFRGTDPDENIPDKDLSALEDSVHSRHLALAELAQHKQLDGLAFPHPLAGKLNFYEWLAFGGIHERLHLLQLRRDVGALPQP